MYKIGVIGDHDSIYGFAALGLSTFFADSADEAASVLTRLTASEYAVIYITEQLASQMTEQLAEYAAKPLPAVIPIPGMTGNTGIGMANVHKSVERAVGSDIL